MDAKFVREAYGWDGSAAFEPGPRGALGRIWRVEANGRRYALKEILSDPPTPAAIQAAAKLAAHTKAPRSHPDREGRFLTPTPQGTWLRLYDWIDLTPLDRTDPQTPAKLGALLADLHKAAPRAAAEVDGGPPSRWYDTVEEPAGYEDLASTVTAADRREMILCHRDLHPENVLADPSGDLVVVDWDQIGPATPGRELARVIFDWFCEPEPDLDAIRALWWAYHDGGGTGRIADVSDFSMLVATRLNFLRAQQRVGDEWARREIAEGLHLMPTPRRLAAVLAALHSSARRR